MTNEMIMMTAVPLNASGLLLNVINRAIPSMEPGTIYGNMVKISSVFVNAFFLRTVT